MTFISTAALSMTILAGTASAQPVWRLEVPGLVGAQYRLSDGRIFSGISGVSPNGRIHTGWTTVGSVSATTVSNTDAWYHAGGATVRIRGLSGAAYEPEGPNWRRRHTAGFVNNAGQVLGESTRFLPIAQTMGSDLWLYENGVCTSISPDHPPFVTATGFRSSSPVMLTDLGHAVGSSRQFLSSGEDAGFSAWVYVNGVRTLLGLAGSDWQGPEGVRQSTVSKVNQQGRIIGSSQRFAPFIGRDWWVWQSGATSLLAVVSADTVSSAGERESSVTVTDRDEVIAGWTRVWQPGTTQRIGLKGWVFSNGTLTTLQPPPGRDAQSGASPLLAGAGAVVAFHNWPDNPGSGEVWHHKNGVQTRLGVYNPIGRRFADAKWMNSAGQVVGFNIRYVSGAASGEVPWLFTPSVAGGGTTVNIYPTDPIYASAQPNAQAKMLTEQGHVVLTVPISGGGADVLVYHQGQFARIDIGGTAGHVTSTGRRHSEVRHAMGGKVVGITAKYNAADGTVGETLWMWDAATGVTTVIPVPQSVQGFFLSLTTMGVDGSVRGRYAVYSGTTIVRYRCFLWSLGTGFIDMEERAGPQRMAQVGLSELTDTGSPDLYLFPTIDLTFGSAVNSAGTGWPDYIFRRVPGGQCGGADLGVQGGMAGQDGQLNNNDLIVFIDAFFGGSSSADVGKQGGLIGRDGLLNNNDVIAFIDLFFLGCGS